MLIKDREKNKSVALFRCDNCSNEWMGNYYVLIKKDEHLCRSCACKKGHSKKRKKISVPKKIKRYIIKRVDGKKLNHLPKDKRIKIIIKCSKCGNIRQSNAFDVINKMSTICKKCCDNRPKKGYGYRRNKSYRKMMSESMKESEAYKNSVD